VIRQIIRNTAKMARKLACGLGGRLEGWFWSLASRIRGGRLVWGDSIWVRVFLGFFGGLNLEKSLYRRNYSRNFVWFPVWCTVEKLI
jgi:hypothetical protein